MTDKSERLIKKNEAKSPRTALCICKDKDSNPIKSKASWTVEDGAWD